MSAAGEGETQAAVTRTRLWRIERCAGYPSLPQLRTVSAPDRTHSGSVSTSPPPLPTGSRRRESPLGRPFFRLRTSRLDADAGGYILLRRTRSPTSADGGHRVAAASYLLSRIAASDLLVRGAARGCLLGPLRAAGVRTRGDIGIQAVQTDGPGGSGDEIVAGLRGHFGCSFVWFQLPRVVLDSPISGCQSSGDITYLD